MPQWRQYCGGVHLLLAASNAIIIQRWGKQ